MQLQKPIDALFFAAVFNFARKSENCSGELERGASDKALRKAGKLRKSRAYFKHGHSGVRHRPFQAFIGGDRGTFGD